MPLTLPSSYSNYLYQKNIAENWLLDLYGDVDSSYTIDEDIDIDETNILINPRISGTDTERNTAIQADIPVGSQIRINDEIMGIYLSQHVSGVSNISTHQLRAQGGTVQRTHADDSKIFTVTNLNFAIADQYVDSKLYYGSIANRPSIRSSIDLNRMTSSVANVTVDLINHNYNDAKLSAELINGTRTYVNRPARLTSMVGNQTDISNGVTIFAGIVKYISLVNDGHLIRLELELNQPWKDVSFPQDKTANGNIYIPVAYGAYTTNTDQSKVRAGTFKQHPVPVLRVADPEILTVMPQAYTDTKLHFYEKSADANVLLTGYQAASENTNNNYDTNANIGIAKVSLRRRFGASPISVADTAGTTAWTNPHQLLRHRTSGQAASSSLTVSSSSGGAQTQSVYYNFPIIMGKFNSLIFIASGTAVWTANTGTNYWDLDLVFNMEDGSTPDGAYFNFNSTNNTGTITLGSGSGGQTASSIYGSNNQDLDALSTFTSNEKKLPPIQLKAAFNSNNVLASTISVTDFVMYVDVESDFSTDAASDSSYNRINQITHLYCGADGLSETYSGSSAVAAHGHEVHRDLMCRFAGYATVTPAGWDSSFHDSSESGGGLHDKRHVDNYAIRYWELNPVSLEDKLNQLAYEFNFIFKIRPDKSGAYIMPGVGNGSNSAYQAADVAATITGADILKNSFEFSQTSTDNLVTKAIINNEVHPALRNTYITSVTSTNATTREKYAFTDKENIVEINLDMNVGTAATTPATDHNSDFYSFIDHLHGDVKDIVNCTIINPLIAYGLETGDIVLFSDMPVEAGGDAWTSKYFMITNLKRDIGSITITAREVSA